MAGSSTRRSPAVSGPALPSIRQAAPTAFAISFRTARRSPPPDRRLRASTCCEQRHGSSSMVMFSTGGCRSRGRVYARGSPTTAHGSPTPPPIISRRPATPPFDQTRLDPGYIKGYPPGIRENGGHYTHAALWSVMAFAGLGQGDKAAQLFSLINPINPAGSRAGVQRYKVEPYVVAADVYANLRHVGRGGWTWYTGSAGWMQRAGIESILGLRLRGAVLYLDPCIPKAWPSFYMTVRYRSCL